MVISCIFQYYVRTSKQMRKQIHHVALDSLSKFEDVEGKRNSRFEIRKWYTWLSGSAPSFPLFTSFWESSLLFSVYFRSESIRGEISFAVVDPQLYRLYLRLERGFLFNCRCISCFIAHSLMFPISTFSCLILPMYLYLPSIYLPSARESSEQDASVIL